MGDTFKSIVGYFLTFFVILALIVDVLYFCSYLFSLHIVGAVLTFIGAFVLLFIISVLLEWSEGYI